MARMCRLLNPSIRNAPVRHTVVGASLSTLNPEKTMWELLYDLLVGAVWAPFNLASRRGENAARSSVILGVCALLLAIALLLFAVYVVLPLFKAGPGVWAMGLLVCLFCIPFFIAWVATAVAGLAMAVKALAGKRRRVQWPLAAAGLFLNLFALGLPLVVNYIM
jgi:hypothetical protein